MITDKELHTALKQPLLFSGNNGDKIETKQNDYFFDLNQLKIRAESGDRDAQFLVGISFMWGHYGSDIDWNKGVKLVVEVATNCANSPVGLCAQGVCFENAIGGITIKNIGKAKEL